MRRRSLTRKRRRKMRRKSLRLKPLRLRRKMRRFVSYMSSCLGQKKSEPFIFN